MAPQVSREGDGLAELIAEHTDMTPEEVRQGSGEFYIQELSEAETVEES